MLQLSSSLVLGYVACGLVCSWVYFRRYQVSRPPVGVFNGRDLALMVPLLILVPLLYLLLPLWLTAALWLLVTLSILSFTWEPLLPTRWSIWLVAVTLLASDCGVAFMGTRQNAFFAVNDFAVLVIVVGITNLWAQSGMKARDTALLALLLAPYDFITTIQLPLMSELLTRLSALPLAPLVAWSSGHTLPSIGLGDLLLAGVFPLVMRKAFGRLAGLVALGLALATIGVLLALPLQGGFPLMVVLGPLMGLQYLSWRRRGPERTTGRYLLEEPMPPRKAPCTLRQETR
ncbi:MAG TPA: hypothetical protein VH540_21655 [Ktedonobacterales bacterium]|jgi:hypothetical protein